MARLRKASKHRSHRRLSLCVLVILTTLAGASNDCAYFVFPSMLHNGRLACQEHTTMTLHFALNIDKCPRNNDKSHFVYVAQAIGESSSDVEFCALRLTHEVCFSYKPQNCRCVKEHGRWKVLFEKVMTQSDNGAWLWQTGDGLEKTIFFDVQPDTPKKDNTPDSPETLEVRLAKKKPQERLDGSKDSDRGSPDSPINSRNKPKEYTHAPLSKEGKFPAKTNPMHTEYIGDDDNDDRDWNPVHDEVKKDDDDEDDDDDDSFGNPLTTGVVVGTLNVISIVVVLVIVYVCRRRKERRAGSPESKPPPPPAWRESYVSSRTVQSGVYDEIPAVCPSFEDDMYLIPVVKTKNCQGNTYVSYA